MTAESRKCGDCRFFDPAGLCRFAAPSVAGWPKTSPRDWCGEWTASRTASQTGEAGTPPGLVRDIGQVSAKQQRLV